MKKNIIIMSIIFTTLLTACSPKDTTGDNSKIKVVSSFTIITDMAEQVGGDLVEVYNLVPTGTDPHEYEPLPDDIKAVSNADILFYNGLNLEGGKSGWFYKLIDSVNQDYNRVYSLNDGVEPKFLGSAEDRDEQINPHSFLSPKVGIKMVENLRDAFIEIDFENKDIYEKNAFDYLKRLEKIDEEYTNIISSLPDDRKLLVTSERAFQYMTETYGLKAAYVWEIDTEELGTVEQIKNLIDILKEEKPPVLFIESNVDPKPL